MAFHGELPKHHLFSAAAIHFHGAPPSHHRPAFVAMGRRAHHVSAEISSATALLGAVQGLQVVPSPQISGELLATAAIASNDIWAVGFSDQGPAPPVVDSTLGEHFNGTSWKIVPTPTPTTNVSSRRVGIAAISANDI
jgi:hypothetical protein